MIGAGIAAHIARLLVVLAGHCSVENNPECGKWVC
jgi:hypothetical protein